MREGFGPPWTRGNAGFIGRVAPFVANVKPFRKIVDYRFGTYGAFAQASRIMVNNSFGTSES